MARPKKNKPKTTFLQTPARRINWWMNHTPTPPAACDEDLDILSFTPVPTTGRADGWTPRRQVDFIRALAVMGTVTRACKAVGMSRQNAYKLRERPDAADFARAWDDALMIGYDRIFSMAMERAINGVTRPRYYRGRQIGTITRPDFRMAMAALAEPPHPPKPHQRPKVTE